MKCLVMLARPWFWLPALASTWAGVRYGAGGKINIWGAFLSLLISGPAISCFAEMLNDVHDIDHDRKGTRKVFGGLPLAGGSGVLAEGFLSISTAYSLMLTSAILGLVAASLASLYMIYLYLLGMVIAWGYSSPPLRLKLRPPYGAIAHMAGYGFVAFHLGVVSQGHGLTYPSTFVSLLIGSWVSLVGMTADLLDYEDDRSDNVITIPVLIGRAFTIWTILAGSGAVLLYAFIHHALGPLWLTFLVFGCYMIYISGLMCSFRRDPPLFVHALAIVLEVAFPSYLTG